MNKTMFLVLFLLIGFVSFDQFNKLHGKEFKADEYVTVAILAKDKAHTLLLYLECIENQTWPKDKTYLYIRTNNNNDCTASILHAWVDRVRDKYADIYFDDTDVETPVQEYGQHEWNYERFKVLGKIRQDSVDWAHKKKSHYFVADCDNFIKPHVLETIFNTNLPIVAPLLRTDSKGASHVFYANYHSSIDKNGYFLSSPLYYQLLNQEVKGLIEVPVIHCTYLIRYDVLDKIYYDDESGRYEYVIFSDSARINNIPQYLDNREIYGRISFAETEAEFQSSSWLGEFGIKVKNS